MTTKYTVLTTPELGVWYVHPERDHQRLSISKNEDRYYMTEYYKRDDEEHYTPYLASKSGNSIEELMYSYPGVFTSLGFIKKIETFTIHEIAGMKISNQAGNEFTILKQFIKADEYLLSDSKSIFSSTYSFNRIIQLINNGQFRVVK